MFNSHMWCCRKCDDKEFGKKIVCLVNPHHLKPYSVLQDGDQELKTLVCGVSFPTCAIAFILIRLSSCDFERERETLTSYASASV
jgi:hypothetical protein